MNFFSKTSRCRAFSHFSASVILSVSLHAEEKRSLEFTWENDSFLSPFGTDFTDRHYTQGFFLEYWNRDDVGEKGFLGSASFMNSLWSFGMDIEATRGGVAFGQEIYTPEDIAFGPSFFGIGFSLDAFDVQSDDRPYAGYLYVGPQWERRGRVSLFGRNSVPARDRVWLLQHGFGQSPFSIELMPTLGFDLGNVSTRLTAGVEARLGLGDIHLFTLPSTARSGNGFGAYFFASAEGWAVAHNIFLDGNTFADSHRVTKEHWVGEVSLGIGFHSPNFEGKVAWVGRSEEFGQK